MLILLFFLMFLAEKWRSQIYKQIIILSQIFSTNMFIQFTKLGQMVRSQIELIRLDNLLNSSLE